MKTYHSSKRGENWQLQGAGAKRATETLKGLTKQEAVKKSASKLRSSGNSSSLKIHKENGRIQEERTYPRSSDPGKSPG